MARKVISPRPVVLPGADDGIRTRDPHLGKVMLYQLSHVRVAFDPIRTRLSISLEDRSGRPAVGVHELGGWRPPWLGRRAS